jgi:hypothetical protein
VKSKKPRTEDIRVKDPDSSEPEPQELSQLSPDQEQAAAPKYVKNHAKPRRSEPARRYDDEYEEDTGRMETQ